MVMTKLVQLVSDRHADGHTIWSVELSIDGRLVDRTRWDDNPARAMLAGQEMVRTWRAEPIAA